MKRPSEQTARDALRRFFGSYELALAHCRRKAEDDELDPDGPDQETYRGAALILAQEQAMSGERLN